MPAIHDTIYLQIFDDEGNVNEEMTWCEDQINESDIEYARVGATQHRLAADSGDALANRVLEEINVARRWLLESTDDEDFLISPEAVATYLNLIERAAVNPTAAKAQTVSPLPKA